MNEPTSGSTNPFISNDSNSGQTGNIPLAIGGGFVASVAGAGIWAVITIATKFQIGWMAVGVGLLVGLSVRKLGKGSQPIFGIIGALFALVGCLLGNFFSLVGFISVQEQIPFFDVLQNIDPAKIPSAMIETGSPMDLLFYGIAVYEGFKFSRLP